MTSKLGGVSSGAAHKPSRGEIRRAAIVAAATDVFLEHGFAAATLDDVVRRAGGSRATLYGHFGGKEGLFAAIIAQQCELIVAPLQALSEEDRTPEKVLADVGRCFMDILMSARGLGLYRMVSAEAARFPALGAQVFACGPKAAADRLAVYLQTQVETGVLALPDADLAARHFLEMVKGDLHTRALFNVAPMPTSAEIDTCVKGAVATFLTGARR
ncbi:MAG: TetR/AcrR family transcriptional regulator [Proteobacteria bacterium]|nr:TetR/AcrR family transcriptional regulator [Pseudomonadota bacterium]